MLGVVTVSLFGKLFGKVFGKSVLGKLFLGKVGQRPEWMGTVRTRFPFKFKGFRGFPANIRNIIRALKVTKVIVTKVLIACWIGHSQKRAPLLNS